jgi:hypothetical protein
MSSDRNPRDRAVNEEYFGECMDGMISICRQQMMHGTVGRASIVAKYACTQGTLVDPIIKDGDISCLSLISSM